MAEDVEKLGGKVHVNFEAAEFEDTTNSILIKPRANRSQESIKVRHLITCAGLYSDRVAKQLGGKVPLFSLFLLSFPLLSSFSTSLFLFSVLYTEKQIGKPVDCAFSRRFLETERRTHPHG
jgi:L-2-hydroxyglutarate oxidase LhgO